MKKLLGFALVAALAGAASADVRLTEILLNPPGSDNGFEFFELGGSAGQSLSGLWLLSIDGDTTASGVVDQAINLSSFSLGSNGLFLFRDSATVIDTSPDAGLQGPSAGTNVHVADFAPDIENGTNTFLLVTNFSGAVGTDLDTDNNGILDASPWASVVDGLGFTENDGGVNHQFATQLGFTGFGLLADDIGGTFGPDGAVRGLDGTWYAADALDVVPGSNLYQMDPNEIRTVSGGGEPAGTWYYTPGAANLIPTPGSAVLVGMGLVFAGRRRR